MDDLPFQVGDWRADPHSMVKGFFNYVYQQHALLKVLDSITQRHGYAYNDEYCFFSDLSDPNPQYHFEGVIFGISDDEVRITEEQCWAYVRDAAAYHLLKNPADIETVSIFLARVGCKL